MTVDVEHAALDDSPINVPCVATDQEQLKMQRFLRWMKKQGAIFPSISIQTTSSGRQVRSTTSLQVGELVAHIPDKLTITPQRARESKIGRLIAEHGSCLDDYDYLAAYLLQVKRDGGFWKPYIDILPTDYSANPLLYSKEELDELRGSYYLNAILNRISRHQYKYDQLPAALKQHGFTREAFTWAKCAVMTRVHATRRGEPPFLAMVPLSDMFDHATQNNTEWAVDNHGGCVIRTERPVERGDRLFESYGRCNAQLLDEYGFCLEDNPKNVAEIRLPTLLPSHPLFKVTEKLGQERWGKRTFRVAADYHSNGTRALFSYLRLSWLGEKEHLHWLQALPDQKIPPVSIPNEIAVLQTLAQACENRLQQFITSLEDDYRLLENAELRLNLRNAIMVRRDEKIILTYFLGLAKATLPVLHAGSTAIGQCANTSKAYEEYFHDLTQHLNRQGVSSSPNITMAGTASNHQIS